MGVSTNAVIFYGYCWEDEGIDLLEGHGDIRGERPEWPEIVLRKRGGVNPWDAYPKEIEKLPYKERELCSAEWIAVNRRQIDEWYAAKQAVEAEFGCDIEQHCSGDCPMPFITITGSGTMARRGYPVAMDAWPLTDTAWDAKLQRFCDELGIAPPEGQRPGWWLVSYWG